jgi:hypothetical protein
MAIVSVGFFSAQFMAVKNPAAPPPMIIMSYFEFNEFVFGGNQISVGTYSLLSTGIDIVHINNLILAPTPGKSFVKTIQSIGRGLRRKTGQKEHINVIDLTSNLKFDKHHIKSRKEYYTESKYPFETDKIEVGQFRLIDAKKPKN